MQKIITGRLVIVRLTLLVAVLALLAVGLATLYAVGCPAESSPAGSAQGLIIYWKKQLVYAAVGGLGFLAANAVNYRRFGAVSYSIYGIILLLLALLLVSRFIVPIPFIPMRNGAYRWIQLGDLPAIQPSELCKLAYILALAWYLRYRSNYRNFKALVGPFALTVLPMVLILLEPDLGTVMLMLPMFFVTVFVAGAKVKHLLIIILLAVLISPFMWFKLEPYQRKRISTVLLQSKWLRDKTEHSPLLARILVGEKFNAAKWESGDGFHITRSKFAVASGGATGCGFSRGPFIKYNFLPERHNDFIFSIIAQQWGFWGCVVLFLLYGIVFACGLEIAVSNTDPFGRFIAVGIVAMFAVEVIVNISMTIGLMPVTGLTLPLVSYGGSSLATSLTAVGLLNNIGRCRPFGMGREKAKGFSLGLRTSSSAAN